MGLLCVFEGETAFHAAYRSGILALYVWLELDGATFSDNFFYVRLSEPHSVSITCDDIALLRVKSLTDTYRA